MLSAFRLGQLRRLIRAGGVIAYPTEAVFGLGCDPCNPAAVERIMQLKGRSVHKGLIVIAADLEQLGGLLAPLDEAIRDRIRPTWPGPVTWLLPASPDCPAWLTGGRDTLAVRISAHPLVRQLCRACGALVSTSANPAGHAPARTPLRVRRYFGRSLDDVVAGRVNPNARPTEIRDARSGRVIRPA